MTVKDGMAFQKKDGSAYRVEIQHVDPRPKNPQTIDWAVIIYAVLSYIIVVSLAYAIAGNVVAVRAEAYALDGDMWCAIMRAGV